MVALFLLGGCRESSSRPLIISLTSETFPNGSALDHITLSARGDFDISITSAGGQSANAMPSSITDASTIDVASEQADFYSKMVVFGAVASRGELNTSATLFQRMPPGSGHANAPPTTDWCSGEDASMPFVAAGRACGGDEIPLLSGVVLNISSPLPSGASGYFVAVTEPVRNKTLCSGAAEPQQGASQRWHLSCRAYISLVGGTHTVKTTPCKQPCSGSADLLGAASWAYFTYFSHVQLACWDFDFPRPHPRCNGPR